MNSTIDDVDSHIVYSTNPAWNTAVWADQRPQPLFNTNHGSPNPGAVATFTFTGTAVYVYGYRGSDHGFRDVSIDGASPVRCNGRTTSSVSRALVYWADGLSPGTHEITLQHTGSQGEYLNIDYFIVTNADGTSTTASTDYPTGSIAGTGPYPTNTQNNSNQSSSPIGIIVGVVVAVAVLSLIAVIWFLWSRRRKVRRQKVKSEDGIFGAGSARNPKAMSAIGLPAEAQNVHPFYGSPRIVGQPHPEVTPMLSPQHRQAYPDSSAGYYSQGGPQSVYSSVPSTYSPPASQIRYEHLPTSLPSTTAGTTIAAPWASSISGEAPVEASQQTMRDPSIAKTRYSGANSLGPSSSSRPLSPTNIDDTVPPPKYEQ